MLRQRSGQFSATATILALNCDSILIIGVPEHHYRPQPLSIPNLDISLHSALRVRTGGIVILNAKSQERT